MAVEEAEADLPLEAEEVLSLLKRTRKAWRWALVLPVYERQLVLLKQKFVLPLD